VLDLKALQNRRYKLWTSICFSTVNQHKIAEQTNTYAEQFLWWLKLSSTSTSRVLTPVTDREIYVAFGLSIFMDTIQTATLIPYFTTKWLIPQENLQTFANNETINSF
jgi:hypothetical protein